MIQIDYIIKQIIKYPTMTTFMKAIQHNDRYGCVTVENGERWYPELVNGQTVSMFLKSLYRSINTLQAEGNEAVEEIINESITTHEEVEDAQAQSNVHTVPVQSHTLQLDLQYFASSNTNIQPNIIGFNSDTVHQDILTFINDERFSDSTRISYMHDIRLFFSFFNLTLETLTHSNLLYENKDIIRYRNFLINDKKLSNNTANRKLASLQSLYQFFKRNKYDTKYNVDTDVFQIDKLKNKSKSYGYIAPEELQAMLQLVLNQVKGYEKYCLIRLATTTSLREDTLLNLTWDSFEKNDQQNCYMVNTVEKKTDKEVNQPISINLYNELLEIKKLTYYQRYSDNRLFHVTTKTIWEMMKTLKEELNIPDKRSIVFHSFRSYGANFILETTGDLVAASNQLNHSNIQTTYQHYINKTKDVQKSAGLLLDEQIDQYAFNKLTLDEMRQLLNDTKNGLRSQLLREATKLIKNREEV